MKARTYIYILAVLLLVAAGVALMRPEDPSNPPDNVDSNTKVEPETLVQKMVAAYERAVDVLYNLKGNEAITTLETIEAEIEEIEKRVAKLPYDEQQKVEQHPDILEVKEKYSTAVERVKIGASNF